MAEDIDYKGPLFDGRAEKAFHDAEKDVEQALAKEALHRVKRHFHMHFKHPTGRYESRVHISTLGRGAEVGDGGSVYGPWLEGTGSRNAPVTRFRGYHAFRDVTAEMDHESERITEERLHTRWLPKME